MIRLESVYRRKDAPEILYALMQEATPEQCISHKVMPEWKDHIKFIKSRPYNAWYIIHNHLNGWDVGMIYLSRQREIGIRIFKQYQRCGYGEAAIKILRRKFPGRMLANVNPKNSPSRAFFELMGCKLIQVTYELK